MDKRNLSEIEKALYVFSRIKNSATEALKEYENQEVNYEIIEEIKENFSLDNIIDFFIPNIETRNYLKAMKKVEWPIAIKFFSQFLEGYLATQYSKEKTTEEVVKDFFMKKFLEYIKG